MMLLERWAVAVLLGMCWASTAGAPGQSPASPTSENTQQTQSNQNQSNQGQTNQDTDDAEPAEFHPPAEIGQPAAPPPPPPPPAIEPKPQTESHPPVSPPAPPVAVPQPPPPPEPPLSSDPEKRQLQIDTAHLLQLTEELKAELDKAGNDTLSIAALRKADEVQRLARMLKERMKDRGQVVQSKP